MTDPNNQWQQGQGQSKGPPERYNGSQMPIHGHYQQPMPVYYQQQPMIPYNQQQPMNGYYQQQNPNQMMHYQYQPPMQQASHQNTPYEFKASNDKKVTANGNWITQSVGITYDSSKKVEAKNITDKKAFHKALDKLF